MTDIKNKIFALYWGQDVLVRWPDQTQGKQTSFVNSQSIVAYKARNHKD